MPPKKISALFVGALLMVAVPACRKSDPRAGSAAPVRPAVEKAVSIAPDRSLSSGEYIALGMPAADRLWSAEDYAQAQRVLSDLAADDVTKLPRAESRSSPEMFARMVAEENIDLAESIGPEPGRRFARIGIDLHAPVNEILKIYVAAGQKSPFFDREQVDLFLLTYAVTARLWKYADLFLAGLSPDDPAYAVRMKGLGQMRDGLAMVVSGSLTTLTEKHAYRREVLVRFAVGLRAHLPELIRRLPPQTKLEVPVRLERMIKAESEPVLKKALEDLLAAVRQAGE